MNNRIRFHLDENVNPVIAKALRQYGIDVTTSTEAEVLSKGDEEQLEFALKENHVIVTHDDDFLRMASQGNEHPGIAYCHLEARSIGEIIRALQLIYEVLLPHEIFGQIEYL
ncbi:DUF5615 family PIN-like protein [Chloroflexi bacterium TSY]|nr:DUF5615 family PIN-like protein [Chloroflexi bacterium TSY]